MGVGVFYNNCLYFGSFFFCLLRALQSIFISLPQNSNNEFRPRLDGHKPRTEDKLRIIAVGSNFKNYCRPQDRSSSLKIIGKVN